MKHCKTLARLWRDTSREWLKRPFGNVPEMDRNRQISQIYAHCAERLEESLRLDAEELDDADKWKEAE